MTAPAYKLVDSTGAEILPGAVVYDFRGDPATVTGFEPPRRPGSTGRVYVTLRGQEREFYPGVFALRIEEAL